MQLAHAVILAIKLTIALQKDALSRGSANRASRIHDSAAKAIVPTCCDYRLTYVVVIELGLWLHLTDRVLFGWL